MTNKEHSVLRSTKQTPRSAGAGRRPNCLKIGN